MNSSTTHRAAIVRPVGDQAVSGLGTQNNMKPHVAPYVEDAEPTPIREIMPGQKRKRRDFWDQTETAESSTITSRSKEKLLAGSDPLLPRTLPKVEQGTPPTAMVPVLPSPENKLGRVIDTPVQDDRTEAPGSSDTTRSYTVEAAPLEQSTPTKINVNVMAAHHDAVQNPSKLARLVMHAFDINQYAFDNVELRHLLRRYKEAISRGDSHDESLQYRTFFLHLWEHVGASRAGFDLKALISGICTYQEMAMTDVEVSRRIAEIKMYMGNEDQDGVKDRAGELWAYVWETYDSEELAYAPALRA